MKTVLSIIKKSCVLLVLVIYLFIALTNTLYLPGRSWAHAKLLTFSNVIRLNKNNGAPNSKPQFHHIYKSVVTNKNNVSTSIKILTAVYLVIFSGLAYARLLTQQKSCANYGTSSQFAFAYPCPLKI